MAHSAVNFKNPPFRSFSCVLRLGRERRLLTFLWQESVDSYLTFAGDRREVR